MCASQSFSTPRHAERSRSRLQHGDDPGGYRAYGYGPLIPSEVDLKVSRFHSERK
jgi:hypothetical protein